MTEYVTENDCRLEEFSFLYFLAIFSLVSFSLFSNIPKFQVEYPCSKITRGHNKPIWKMAWGQIHPNREMAWGQIYPN